MCKSIRCTDNVGRKCVASIEVRCTCWRLAINDAHALLRCGRTWCGVNRGDALPLGGECAMRIKLCIAYNFNRERHAVANNLCKCLCDE